MVRPFRIEYEGAVYHVTSRGNAQAAIYLTDADREMFLDVLAHVVERFSWVCHAYCLMGNHYHLMIETPQANLSRGMRQLNGMYTQRFNREHKRVGHVFQGRFKSIVVDKNTYLLELCRYIVRNPVAANIVGDVGEWPWSSYAATAGIETSPPFLTINWLLAQFGNQLEGAQASYQSFVRNAEQSAPWQGLNGPDVLGDDEFRSELQQFKGEGSREIPRRKQTLRHLPLHEIEGQGKPREVWMNEAYQEHGYTMQAIADHVGIHHSTVSRLIKRDDKNARNKT